MFYINTGSTWAVIILIFGNSLNTLFNPYSQLTKVKNIIFSSFTPLVYNTFNAILALPPVPNIGSTKIIYYSFISSGSFSKKYFGIDVSSFLYINIYPIDAPDITLKPSFKNAFPDLSILTIHILNIYICIYSSSLYFTSFDS